MEKMMYAGILVGQKTRVCCESISRFKTAPEKIAIALSNRFALSTRFLRITVRLKNLSESSRVCVSKMRFVLRFLHVPHGFCDLGSRLIAFYFCDLNPAIWSCVCCPSKAGMPQTGWASYSLMEPAPSNYGKKKGQHGFVARSSTLRCS